MAGILTISILKDMYAPAIIIFAYKKRFQGGARGVMVTVVGNGHSDTSSNPGRDWLYFT